MLILRNIFLKDFGDSFYSFWKQLFTHLGFGFSPFSESSFHYFESSFLTSNAV